MRQKKGKTIQERLDLMLKDAVYDTVRQKKPYFRNILEPMEGDVAELSLGLSDTDYARITEEVDFIIHMAATTNFNAPLRQATLINVRGTRECVALAKACKKLQCFTYVSTAFTHATESRIGTVLNEQFYACPVTPDEIIDLADEADSTQPEQMAIEKVKGWPNTYTFTKAIAEELIRISTADLPVCVVKPPIAPSSVPTCEPETSGLPEKWKMPLAGAGVAVGILVIALAATATYYRTKVKLLNRHKNLNMRSDRIEEEEDSNDRYSTNPLQKGKKGAQIFNQSRESDIYEDPKITLGVSPMPPALPTSPRPDRTCNTLKIPPSPSSTLISNASSQMTFPRRNNPKDKDTLTKIAMANRPPLPLPQDEFYNEVKEDDTYEPPPIHELLSQTPVTNRREKLEKMAKPIPEKIVRPRPEKSEKPTPDKLGKKLLHIPMDGLKPPGMNVPPKPHGVPVPQRNNVVQVPVRQIPDPSSLKRAPPVKPKPPVALPKTVPVPYIEPEEYHSDRHDSTDDEEWTYEPLPSFNIYSS